jgi:hypothetical protein
MGGTNEDATKARTLPAGFVEAVEDFCLKQEAFRAWLATLDPAGNGHGALPREPIRPHDRDA